MSQVETDPADHGRALRRAVIASSVGSVLEWYDFSIYGSAAAIAFGPLFFPKFDPLIGTLAAFGTYAVGFLARPLGGVFFGNLGDRVGRRTVLLLTVVLMGVATFCIGLLPTYSSIGVAAAVLLLLLRVLQGFGSGAEQGGAMVLTSEFAPEGRRGFYVALPFVGIVIGIVLASGVFALASSLPRATFLAWGWRVPFLLSIVVIGIGLYIRYRLRETPIFEAVKEKGAAAELPLRELFRTSFRNLAIGFGSRIGENGGSYVFQVFVLTYLVAIGVKSEVGLIGTLIAAAAGIVTLPVFGALSDRVGRRPVFIGCALFAAVFVFPYFWLLNTKMPVLIWLACLLSLGVGTWGMLAAEVAFLTELFPTRVRYSGVALSRELSAPVAGGVAPFVATALLVWSGKQYWPIAIYLIVMLAITIVSVWLAPETRWRSLREATREELAGVLGPSPSAP